MVFNLTKETKLTRDKALLDNLRYKFKQLSNYPDTVILEAYDKWATSDEYDCKKEELFLDWLEIDQ